MRKGWNCIGMKKRAMPPRFTVLNRKIRNKKGYTLAEVTITLALTVVLAGAAFFFLERGLALYGRIQAAADAVSVSDMVLSRISGEIKRAGTDSEAEIGGGENGCQYLVLSGPARPRHDCSYRSICRHRGPADRMAASGAETVVI